MKHNKTNILNERFCECCLFLKYIYIYIYIYFNITSKGAHCKPYVIGVLISTNYGIDTFGKMHVIVSV